jgi:hypothetical protein
MVVTFGFLFKLVQAFFHSGLTVWNSVLFYFHNTTPLSSISFSVNSLFSPRHFTILNYLKVSSNCHYKDYDTIINCLVYYETESVLDFAWLNISSNNYRLFLSNTILSFHFLTVLHILILSLLTFIKVCSMHW